MFGKFIRIAALIAVVVLTAGCDWSGFKNLGLGPKEVAEKFWNATKTGKVVDAAPYVTKASLSSIKDKKDNEPNKNSEYRLGEPKIDGDNAVIPTEFKDQGFTINMQTFVVKEDGKWKVDADKTMMSALAGAFESFGAAMGEGIKSAGEEIKTGSENVGKKAEQGAKSLGEGFKSMGEGLGKAMEQGMKGFAAGLEGGSAKPEKEKKFNAGDAVLVEWHGSWWPAKVTEAKADQWKIHYDGYDKSWDEWVGPDRIKKK